MKASAQHIRKQREKRSERKLVLSSLGALFLVMLVSMFVGGGEEQGLEDGKSNARGKLGEYTKLDGDHKPQPSPFPTTVDDFGRIIPKTGKS